MKRYLSRLLAVVLSLVMTVMAVPGVAMADSLSGNYKEDTLAVIDVMRSAIAAAPEDSNRVELQDLARKKINDYASRYRRGALTKLSSFTTMRTAVNSLAGHYSSYPNRPVPAKLKSRLQDKFKQVEIAINRGI